MAEVYVVTQVKAYGDDGWATDWDLGGVFTTPEKAAAVCTEPGWGYHPVELDEFFGYETVPCPGMVFPAGDL